MPGRGGGGRGLARYAGRTHALYAYQLREWFTWCEPHGLDPLVGIQRAHAELYIRGLGERGLMDSSGVTMMHAGRGCFRFADIDGLIGSDPAVYARLPKVHRDESRAQGLDRLELIRFLQVAQTITVHHGALGFLLGINALRVLEACRGQRTSGPLILRPLSGNPIDRRDAYRIVARIAKAAGIPRHISPTPCGTPRSPTPSTSASRYATPRSSPATPTRAPPSTTTPPEAASTDTASTSSPHTSPATPPYVLRPA